MVAVQCTASRAPNSGNSSTASRSEKPVPWMYCAPAWAARSWIHGSSASIASDHGTSMSSGIGLAVLILRWYSASTLAFLVISNDCPATRLLPPVSASPDFSRIRIDSDGSRSCASMAAHMAARPKPAMTRS